MSEVWGQQDEAAFAGRAAAIDTLTAGALLRRAREEAGIHVAALAVSLKVPMAKLEALEEDRWDVLPDAVFVRALAASICRTLKIDSQPVLERLPQTTAPRLIQSGDGINTPFRGPSDTAPGWLEQLSRPVFLAVLALLLGALVLILLPTAQIEEQVAAAGSTPAPAAASQPAARSASAAQPAVMTVSAPQGEQPAGPAAAPSSLAPTAAAAAASESGPGARLVATAPASAHPAAGETAVNATPAASAATESATAAATPASGIIVFRTKGDSWIEVTDANGVVAVRRVLARGEAAAASGALPLQVVIGRVDATDVQVRGKPFDLRRVSRDNVARFQVK